MKLILYPDPIVLCKLKDTASLDDWQGDGRLHVIINDPHGKTVICHQVFAATRVDQIIDQSLWHFFQVDEVFDVNSIGIVAEFSRLLADQQISLFVISSYETDYLLVQPNQVQQACQAFEAAGHTLTKSL